jgi:2-keto-4-pentenoate hydratase/2-oxohepta-3-ene-1,7-dioic acid hydratase in catechol pathway
MRIIRFLDSVNQLHFGVDQNDGTALRIEGDILANYTVTHQKVAIQKRLAPLQPTAIFCIGLNYRKHAEETGAKIPEFPVLFMKNPGAVQNPGDPIEIPSHLKSTEVDWECELAVVIGKRAKNVSKEQALDHVLGYTAANDVSARDWQRQWGGTQCTLIAFLSGSTTLLPGTVILTGTPSGVGMGMKPPVFLKPGDSVAITIEKIGEITNPVIAEPAGR